MDPKTKLVDLIIEAKMADPETGSFTEFLAEHLINHDVIVLPFPIGTTYYRVVTKRAKDGRSSFAYIRVASLNYYNIERVLRDFGATVFLTRAEAEAALARWSGTE